MSRANPAQSYRRCYRRPTLLHHVDSPRCDCLRTELPIEAQAKSSGALGTPGRNHDCPECKGKGVFSCEGIGVLNCFTCLGSGELTSTGGLVVHDRTDSAIRKAVSAGRKANRLGAR